MPDSPDCVDRESSVTGILVKCALHGNDPRLNGLFVTIQEIQDRIILSRTSSTSWKWDEIVVIPPLTDRLSVILWSENAGNIGQVVFERQDWFIVPDESGHSEHRLERDLEVRDGLPKLSISLEVCTDVMGELLLDDLAMAVPLLDSNMLHSIMLRLPDDDSLKPEGLNFCGERFYEDFTITRDNGDISRAISAYEKAIECLPADDSRQVEFDNNLGRAYMSRYETWGEVKDLEKAINNLRTVTERTTEGHEDLATRLNSLGTAYSHRFKRTGNLVHICEVIDILERAVKIDREKNPLFLSNLGQAFVYRFEHSGDKKDLSEAVKHLEHAGDISPEHADWLNNLGNAFSALFQLTGDLYDISQAIQFLQRAVHLTSEDHADLPAMLNNLGNSFSRRHRQFGRLSDISDAIESLERAVSLTQQGYAILPLLLNNLGSALLNRFGQTENSEDISNAIRYMQRGVDLITDRHADLPRQLNNLGITFSRQYAYTGDIDHIAEAIRNQKLAVKHTPKGHADLPARLSNLGLSFLRRFDSIEDEGDLSEATENLEEAIRLTPPGHANRARILLLLGNSALLQYQLTEDPAFFTKAVTNYRLSAMSSTGSLPTRLEAAQLWSKFCLPPHFLSSESLEAHDRIIHLLSLISGLENTVQDRHKKLIDYSELSITASAAAFSLDRPDKALEWLAEGRCIVWNQLLQLRTPVDALRKCNPDLAGRLSRLAKALEDAGSRTDTLDHGISMEAKISLQEEANSHIKHAKDWEELLSTIRNIEEFKHFLRPKQAADIMSDLLQDGPVIIISVHEERCDALALMAGLTEPLHILLPKFSLSKATNSVEGLRSYLSKHGIRQRVGTPIGRTSSSHTDGKTFQNILHLLWSDVVEPILEALPFPLPELGEVMLPRIWWCPTGPLAFLPLHAAGVYSEAKSIRGQRLADFAVSSYIPTLNIFNDKSDSPNQGASIASGMLIVCQASTPGYADIPYATEEVRNIKAQLDKREIRSSLLDGEDGTVDRVLELMETFPCIHLACHAFQHRAYPLESAICLNDGRLELLKIMKKNLPQADLAFMSACQTSRGDDELTEEVVHLAAGMLAAGYRNVVGTMWSVIDKHGPDLADFFYSSLFDYAGIGGTLNGRDAARSLHRATEKIREKLPHSPNSLLAWVPYIHVGV